MVMFFVLLTMGSVFASSIEVDNVNMVKKDSGYIVSVHLTNDNEDNGLYEDLYASIDGLDEEKEIGSYKVYEEGKELVFSLDELTDHLDLLKKGEVYTLRLWVNDKEVTESFVLGTLNEDNNDIVIDSIKINDEKINGDELSVMNGQELKIDLRITALDDFEDGRIRATIEGYEHNIISDSTSIFSLKEDKTYVKTLTLQLPSDMKSQKDYKLRIMGANDLSGEIYKDYVLYIDTERHRVDVLDVVVTPSVAAEPGQNIIVNARVKNLGQKEQESVKVIISIPELGMTASTYLTNLDNEEAMTSDDMLLFVPENTTPGTYQMVVETLYNDGYDSSKETFDYTILSPKIISEQNLIVSNSDLNDLEVGKTKSFEVVIANPNSESKPVSLTSENIWADVSINPNLAMIKGGEDAKFVVSITPKKGIVGEKDFILSVKEGNEIKGDVSFKTYVEDNSINYVNVSLSVLLVIAVIILISLIVVIYNRKKEKVEEENIDEEYY